MTTSAYRLALFVFAPFLAASVFSSCSKEQQVKPDIKPVRIQTYAVGNVSMDQVTLNAEILYLNDEKVLDFGFIIKTPANSDEKKISMGNQAKPGLISHVYRPTDTFPLGESYQYTVFLSTEAGTYYGEYHHFRVKDFWVDQEGVIPITLGDTLILTGNFKQVSDDYVVKTSHYNNNSNLRVIDKTDHTLSIKIPDNLGVHRQSFDLYISRNNPSGSSHYYNESLIRIIVLGKVEFLIDKAIYPTDVMKTSAFGVNWANNDFLLIVGDKKLSYYSHEMRVDQLGLYGIKHRLGYYNGADTILSTQTLRFIEPQAGEFKLLNSNLHPGERMAVESPNMWKYFREWPVVEVDGNTSNSSYYSPTSIRAQTPILGNGTYYVTIKSPIYGNIPLDRPIELSKIKAQVRNKRAYYYNDEIHVQGNFREGVDYVAQIGQYELYRGKATDGSFRFKLTQAKFGRQTLQVGFVDEGWYPVFGDAEEIIEVVGAKIDSFYPSEGYSGDIVTLAGKGFLQFYTSVFMADVQATILSVTDTELKFIVPTTVRKGKFPIELDYFLLNGHVASEQMFELK